MISDGASWPRIGLAFGITAKAAHERCKRAALTRRDCALPGLHRSETDPGRSPFCAGHPASWRAITEGTLLAGVPYPFS